MGLVGVTIQDPGYNPPTNWSGLITDVLTYTVRRQVNGAGSFAITMRASAQEVSQIKTGWKISLKEERMIANPDIVMPEWILRYGRVLSRAYHIDDAGGGIFEVQGETWLGQFINNLIKTRLTFANANLSTIASGLISNTGVSASHSEPLRTVSQELTIALNDQTLLANLIKMAELTRTNLRENWNADTWEFTDQDDLPATGGILSTGAGDIFLRQVEYADPKQAPNNGFGPGQYGVGIIQGIPTVSYDGKDIVNLVVGIGTEWDGSELTLEDAAYFDSKYTVGVTLGGDGNPYWFIQDNDSATAHGPIDFHLVRSDIKNPSNDPTTRAKAKAALLAVTSNELLRRRSETQTISVQVLNGQEIATLPGDRVHLRYKGNARLASGRITWLDVDQYYLVVARTDSGNSVASVRQVVLDLAAPTIAHTIPALPNAVAIPTPRAPIFPHDPIPFDPGPPGGDYNTSLPPLPDPANMSLDSFSPLVDTLKNLTEGNGAYQPCCADPTTDIHSGVVGPTGTGHGTWDDAQLRGPGSTLETTFNRGEILLALMYTDDHSDPLPSGTLVTVTAIVGNQVVPGFPFTYGGLTNVGLYLIEILDDAATVNWGTANTLGTIIQTGVTSVSATAGDIQFIVSGASGSTTASAGTSPPNKTVGLAGFESLALGLPTVTGDLYSIGPIGPFSTIGARVWGGDSKLVGGNDIGLDVIDNGSHPALQSIIFSGAVECDA